MTKCSTTGCEYEGEWVPSIASSHDGVDFSRSFFPPDVMTVCTKHKETTIWEDVVLPEGFAKIRAAFQAAGRLPPTRAFSHLEWISPEENARLYQEALHHAYDGGRLDGPHVGGST